jgi:ABC-2 type transport system permease protein
MNTDKSTTIHSLSQVTWRSHLRSVGAVAWKNWLHFLRYPLSALFSVVQPIMGLTPLYFLGQSFKTPTGNTGFAAYTGTTDYLSFILLGALLSSYVGWVFWGIAFALKMDMESGVLESNWLTPVSRLALLTGQTLANLLTTTLVNVGILAIGWLFFGFRVNGNVLAALAVAVPMLLALYGFGFGFAALVLLVRDPNILVDVSDYLFSLFSGNMFPVRALPVYLLPIALALPLTYGLDAIRSILLGTTTLLPLAVEIAILLVAMVVLLPLGYAIFWWVERRCKQAGTIGLH